MNKLSPLLSGMLTLTLVVPVVAQADVGRTQLVADLGRTISVVQAELAALDQRAASDDWMVFRSEDHGLIEVDLTQIDTWIPAVQLFRDGPAPEQATSDSVATRMPDLWEASVLLADAPDWVLEAGGDTLTAWLWDRFGHLQTPERRAALYDAERALLLEELDALRQSREFFQTEMLQNESPQTETAQTETTRVEAFCREIALGETLMADDGSTTYLGEPIPPIEELPDWCRDALLVRLTGSDGPIPTPPSSGEVAAREPIRRSEDDIGVQPLPDVRHARWDGVWEYWGAPTLTLQQVGEYVYGTYQDGDGWMKLAVVNDRALQGRWYEHEHAASCDEARDGTVHWGTVVMSFDEDFDSYWGDFGTCDSLGTPIEGSRAR
jgi:hypothetical protein